MNTANKSDEIINVSLKIKKPKKQDAAEEKADEKADETTDEKAEIKKKNGLIACIWKSVNFTRIRMNL